jgi:UDP-galactopyranose mutase
MRKKIVVVGTGFSGTVIAREIAMQLDRKVEIVEKRNHIAGNMYDYYNEHGILVQKYGPHFLGGNKWSLIEYVAQFAELFEHVFSAKGFIDDNYITLPFNFDTIKELVGPAKAEILYDKIRGRFSGRRVSVLDLKNCGDPDIDEFGDILFEKAFRTYIPKMWGIQPEEIDRSVVDRALINIGYEARYGFADYYYMPVNGFTPIFEKMLSHKNIEVAMNTDALKHITFDESAKIALYDGEAVDALVFTGPIDELFSVCYGALPYRTLDIRFEHFEEESVLPADNVYYQQASGYTRKTEFRKFMFNTSGCKGSTISTEYPLQYDRNAEAGLDPYYPIQTEENRVNYAKYRERADSYKNLFVLGRLGDFKYYGMCDCIERALSYFEDVKSHLLRNE